jgi:hypothetical protein
MADVHPAHGRRLGIIVESVSGHASGYDAITPPPCVAFLNAPRHERLGFGALQ